jgi:HEAT repeat protein
MRALRVVRALRMVERMRESIHRLANDQNTIVRSLAVSLLGSLPDPTTVRVLRTAINDPDERVQANAIESLDRLGVSERIPLTAPKLESRHGRVRANAVRSLLRAERHEAGETLLAMLEDTSRGQRLSALWVVDCLRLRVVRDRVHAISRGDLDEQVRKRAGRVLASLADNRPGRMCRPVAPDRLGAPLVANGRNL